MNPVLQLTDVTRTHGVAPHEVFALRGVSFAAYPGEDSRFSNMCRLNSSWMFGLSCGCFLECSLTTTSSLDVKCS